MFARTGKSSQSGMVRAPWALVGLFVVVLATACDGSGGGSQCDPVCDADQCETCVDGLCSSTCAPDEVCNAGACIPAVCEPTCDASQCEVCANGVCAPKCAPDQTCENGECQGGAGSCTPACDADACQSCVEGLCTYECGAEQECVSGRCITPSVCEPACDASACEICDGGACASLCEAGERCVDGACEVSDGLTVFDIQDTSRAKHPAADSEVTLDGVIVTAIDGRTADEGSFWVQDPVGGAWSGVKIFNRNNAIDVRMLSVGTRVDLTGTYKEFFDLTEIDLISFTVVPGTARTPVVTVVDAAAVGNGGADAEKYEGCLVRVEGVTVTNANPDGPDNDYGEFEVGGALRVDDDLYLVTPDPQLGDAFAGLTGVLNWSFENRKLLPRFAADAVPAGAGCVPACDASACQTCQGGQCASACTGEQVCDMGTCVTPSTCEPACDAQACEVCDGGSCRSRCRAGETCEAGACVGDGRLRVRDVQDLSSPLHPAENDEVTLEGVGVSAVDAESGDFWVQDAEGGRWSGIKVFNKNSVDITGVTVGTPIDLVGVYKEFYDLSELELVSFAVVPVGGIVMPVATDVTPASVANGGADAEAFEGVLVRVVDVTVTNANPDAPGGDYGEFEVGGSLRVDDEIFRAAPDPAEGDTFASITGVMTWGFDNRKLLPRFANDLVEGGAACEPACDASACEVCRGGQCASSCLGGQTCNAGVCEGEGDLTIYDIQDVSRPGHPSPDSDVTLVDVVVTAIDANTGGAGNFWVQDADGGKWSGIQVYNPNNTVDVSGLSVGARVTVSGTYVEFNDVSEIRLSSVTPLGAPTVAVAPASVTPAAIGTGGADAEAYEGVLVRVADVTVTNANPDEPAGDYGEFEVGGALRVDDDLFRIEPDPAVGATFASLTGVLHYGFSNFKLLPRSAADVVPGGTATCTPACDANACQVCRAGTCASRCTGGQTCNAGVCEGGGGGVTVYDIQDEASGGHPAVDSAVTVEDVIVTAIDANGGGSGNFWVQEPDGGPYSGIMVFNPGASVDVSDLRVGMHLVVNGTYVEFNGVSEIRLDSWDFAGAALTDVTPEVVSAADIATGGADAEAYEGVLVKVAAVAVTNANPDAPAGDYGEFEVAGALRIDDDLYLVTPDPVVGDTFTSITGVLHYGFANFKLLPRSGADVVTGGAATCEPACNANACMECRGGVCVSRCTGEQVCNAGTCEGGGGGAVTIYDVQDETSPDHPAVDSAVTVEDVVVTAIDTTGGAAGSFWAQEADGGPWSGVRVFNQGGAVDVSALTVGARVDLSGTFIEFNGLTEIDLVSVTVLPLAPIQLEPETVDPAAVGTGGVDAEAYEGVLVRVENVTVTDANPDAPGEFGEFLVDDALRVDDDLFVILPDPGVGDGFVSVTGVMTWAFDNAKLLPRDADDVVAGAAACDPACDASACLVCDADTASCVPLCVGDEVCNGGACLLPPPPAISIYDIQDVDAANHPAADSVVALEDVIVTAVDANGTNAGGLWVQEADGGPWSGIYLFNAGSPVDISGIVVGSHVSLSGTYKEYFDLSEIQLAAITVLDVPPTDLEPVVAAVADIGTGGVDAEAYEGVLVRVENVAVTSENPDDPAGNFGEFEVGSALRVDDDIFLAEPLLGDCFSSITGVLTYGYSNFKLLPRDAADLVSGDTCP